MADKKYAPTGLLIIGGLIAAALTVLYGYGVSSNSMILKSFCFVGNLMLVIVLCNLTYKRGLEKNL